MDQHNCYAVIVAAGRGKRMGTDIPKQLLPYRGRTVLECAALPFAESGAVSGVVIVIPEKGDDEEYAKIAGRMSDETGTSVSIVRGGPERSLSVRKGLAKVLMICVEKRVSPDQAYVLIHDGARPNVSGELVDRAIKAFDTCDAVCAAVSAIDSMRTISGNVLRSNNNYPIMDTKVLDRRKILNVQTPQGFKLSDILAAYGEAESDGFTGTDDASVAEHAGIAVAIIEGDHDNIKITTGKDIPMNTRVGIGYDVHRLVLGGRLILCGAPVPSKTGLLGHSDADVATHAIMDAILGAAGKGDIGEHFPDTDEKYLDADSLKLLAETKKIGGDINVVNVDVTIIAERPKLAPYKEAMRKNIAEALDMPETAVNIKATTTEGLGFTGDEEGIAAIATCQIEGRFQE